jgi:hypothetical protein
MTALMVGLHVAGLNILTVRTSSERIGITNWPSCTEVVLKSVNLSTESVRHSTGRRLNEN